MTVPIPADVRAHNATATPLGGGEAATSAMWKKLQNAVQALRATHTSIMFYYQTTKFSFPSVSKTIILLHLEQWAGRRWVRIFQEKWPTAKLKAAPFATSPDSKSQGIPKRSKCPLIANGFKFQFSHTHRHLKIAPFIWRWRPSWGPDVKKNHMPALAGPEGGKKSFKKSFNATSQCSHSSPCIMKLCSKTVACECIGCFKTHSEE